MDTNLENNPKMKKRTAKIRKLVEEDVVYNNIEYKILGKPYYQTDLGKAYHRDSLEILKKLPDSSINLVMTSPPFALVKKKKYGNVSSEEYLDWFRPFIKEIFRVITKDGSFVLDIGGSWVKGSPTKSLYQFELMIMIVKEFGFHLAQDFYWYNPSKLPTPAEWVTIRRIRVKDAVNTVWWFSKSEFPKANNKNILKPYSKSMEDLLKNGYKPNLRPSGHNISDKFQTNNKGAIPPNLIELANTESSSAYLDLCKKYNLEAHPARFPIALPELFVKFLTDENDIVFDPFGGSNTTGEACEINNRRWIISELNEDYLKGSIFRFNSPFSTINNI